TDLRGPLRFTPRDRKTPDAQLPGSETLEWRGRQRVVDCLQCIGIDVGGRLGVGVLALQRCIEKRSIAHNWPSDCDPSSQPRQRGAATACLPELWRRVEQPRLTEQKGIAVHRVRAAPRDNVDAAPGGAAVFS